MKLAAYRVATEGEKVHLLRDVGGDTEISIMSIADAAQLVRLLQSAIVLAEGYRDKGRVQ